MAPSIFIEIDLEKRIIRLEPSFMTYVREGDLRRIVPLCEVDIRWNLLIATYTRGWEVEETVAAMLAALIMKQRVDPHTVAVTYDADTAASKAADTALRIAVQLLDELAARMIVREATELVAMLENRISSADRTIETHKRNIAYGEERVATDPSGSSYYTRELPEEKKRLRKAQSDKRRDPARLVKAEQALRDAQAALRQKRRAMKGVRQELRLELPRPR